MSLLRRILAKILIAVERREIPPTVCSVTFLVDGYNATPPRHWWLSWCSLLNILSPPCFHTSAGIIYPPGALPYFRPAIVLAISSMVGISSRHILVMRCGMLFRASWSMYPGTLCSFKKCSFHLATTLLLSDKVYIPSVDFRWTGPFILVVTLPSVHCRSPSCRFCQQLSAAHCFPFPPAWLQCTGSIL